MPSLSPTLKQHILSDSANALKLFNNVSDLLVSFDQLHILHKRAPPNEMMKYRLAIQLYKSYNEYISNDDWMDLNLQLNFNSRLLSVQINDFSKLKIGKNILMNRMGVLNNEINYSWLNLSLTTFKLKCKEIFLSNILLKV